MKLSTEKIRSLLKTWICTDEVKERIKFNYFSENECNEVLDRWRGWLKLKPSATMDDMHEALWKQWCNVKQWKRADKRRLSDGEWKYFLFEPNDTEKDYHFISDYVVDDCNKELIKYYFDHPDQAEKLVYRILIPDNEHGDNMRIEIVTTHNDDAVVGWCVTSD